MYQKLTPLFKKLLFIVVTFTFIFWLFAPKDYWKKPATVINLDEKRVTDPELDSLIREEKRVTDSVNIALRKKESLRILKIRRASAAGSQKEYEEMVEIRDEIEDRIRFLELQRRLIEIEKTANDHE